jgi:hypothetical protein
MGRLANLRIVPFSKRKPGRSPLQRLSDSRRSLALGGLALGVVFSAGVFRRKRRPAEIEFEHPAPSAPAQPDPPVAVEVPPPASEPATGGPIAAVAPEPETDPAPINATTTAGATVEPTVAEQPAAEEQPAAADADPAPTEPATGELSAAEASILAVLAQSGRADEDRTAIAVATSLERETTDVAGVLRKLSSEGVVSGDLYTAAGDKIWAVTERGVRRLGAQH